jgi:hypothetical protein
MTCSKCNKIVNPDWLCCPFHTELVMLKEKCSECGEMEWIGRIVCENKVRKISDELESYTNEKLKKKCFVLRYPKETGIILLLVCFFVTLFASSHQNWVVSLLLSGCLWIVFFLYMWWSFSKIWDTYSEIKDKFYKIHPDYLDLVNKAAGAREKDIER